MVEKAKSYDSGRKDRQIHAVVLIHGRIRRIRECLCGLRHHLAADIHTVDFAEQSSQARE